MFIFLDVLIKYNVNTIETMLTITYIADNPYTRSKTSQPTPPHTKCSSPPLLEVRVTVTESQCLFCQLMPTLVVTTMM